MKTLVFSLFILLQSGALFAQFDETYYGYYQTDDESMGCYITYYHNEIFSYLNLNEEQKANCLFVFAFQTLDTEGSGGAIKSGNSFVSIVNEVTPQMTFAFIPESGGKNKMLEITDDAGTKTRLTLQVAQVEDYSDDEYADSSDYDYFDEEQPIAMEDLGMDIRGYSRSDGADLVMIISDESVVFSIHVPATKTCSEVMIEGVFDSPELINNAYTFTNEEMSYTLEVKASDKIDNGWQVKCLKGDCFDKKNKCGIWKEAFMLNN